MIHFIPLENLEERYTVLMNNIVNKSGKVKSYYPNDWEQKQISKGEFLDIERTIEFKARQLQMISQAFQRGEVMNGDWFFFADIFFSGLDAVKYMSELQGIKVKVAAFNHAGRADEYDFVQNLGPWADSVERSWHNICDIVFVGSEFQRQNIRNYFYIDEDKIHVTGCVWNNEEAYKVLPIQYPKIDRVIFPHRIAKEKGIGDFLKIARAIPEKQFLITSSSNKECGYELPDNVTYMNNLRKIDYYSELSHSKYYLSTAYQETFGYTLREALLYNCRVVAPKALCYPEMLPEECLYERGDIETIRKYLSDDYKIDEKFKNLYDNSFENMLSYLK
tara:strand:- start:8328 stop:9329 length:1002 start_codon:yes stop_codon:yes gene_type:complete